MAASGLDVDSMQQEKFEAASRLLEATEPPSFQEPTTSQPSTTSKPTTRQTLIKLQSRVSALEAELRAECEKPFSVTDAPELFAIEKVQPTKRKSKKLTNVKGSVNETNVLELVAQANAEKESKIKAKQIKVDNKLKRTESYIRCQLECVCGESVCVASGLKRCEVCKDVMKSQCSKARCKVDTGKPTMTPVFYDLNKKRRKVIDALPTCSKDGISQEKGGEEEEEEEVVSDDSDVFFEHYYLS